MTNTDNEKNLLYLERLNFLYRRGQTGLLANFVNSSLITIVLWNISNHVLLLAWLIYVFLLNIFRLIFIQIFLKEYYLHQIDFSNGPKWDFLFFMGVVLSACGWGVVPALFMKSNTIIYPVFLSFVIGGMVSGSLSTLSASKRSVFAFILITIIPQIIFFSYNTIFASSYNTLYLSMMAMTFIFTFIVLVVAKQSSADLLETFEIRRGNFKLLIDLTKTNLLYQKSTNELKVKIENERLMSQSMRDLAENQSSFNENALTAVYILNHDGKFMQMNPVAEKITGYAESELLNIPFSNILSPEEIPKIWGVFQSLMTNGIKVEKIDTKLIKKNGEIIDIFFSASPIRKNNQIIGVIGSAEDITLIKRHQLIQKMRISILEELASGKSAEQLFMQIIETIEKYFTDIYCSILLTEPSRKTFSQFIISSMPENLLEYLKDAEIKKGLGFCKASLLIKERVIVEDIYDSPYWINYHGLAATAQIKSCWSEPMVGSDQTILGTFAIYHKSSVYPDANEINMIEECARLSALILEKKKIEKQMFLHNQELTVLYNISRLINESFDKEKVFDKILDLLIELDHWGIEPRLKVFKYINKSLFLIYNSDKNNQNEICKEIKPGECLCGLALEKNEIIISDNNLKDKRHYFDDGISEIHGHIIIPLKGKKGINGVLCLFKNTNENSIDDHILKVLYSIGNQVALAVDNTSLFEQMKSETLMDPLTGIYNRRFFSMFLENAKQKFDSEDFIFSALMIDIDHFKKYNDENGHNAGDLLLKKVTELIVEEIREEDFAFRMGGEEFLVILVNSETISSHKVAERIRLSIIEKTGITVSIGIETCDNKHFIDQCIENADSALYNAKNKGRNNTEIFKTKK